MTDKEAPKEAKTDTQGRIVDQLTGRPLRDRGSRTHDPAAFRGKPGKAHPRAARLQKRIDGFESVRDKGGYKRPGSLSK